MAAPANIELVDSPAPGRATGCAVIEQTDQTTGQEVFWGQSGVCITSVSVVGAGIVGGCTAIGARRRGYAVAWIDRSVLGEGCSFGKAGILGSQSSVSFALAVVLRVNQSMRRGREGSMVVRREPAIRPAEVMEALSGVPGYGLSGFADAQSTTGVFGRRINGDSSNRDFTTNDPTRCVYRRNRRRDHARRQAAQ